MKLQFLDRFAPLLVTLFLSLATPHAAGAIELFRWRLPHAVLIDHTGASIDLAAAMHAREGVTVLAFTFLGCQTVCPPAELEMQRLDATLPADARLLTMTLDPMGDTVERLAVRAGEHQVSDRWRFVTGEPIAAVDMLERLGLRGGNLNDHPPLTFVAIRGRIYRIAGQMDADVILALIRRVAS